MKQGLIAIAVALIASALPHSAAAEGRLGTLARGKYVCEMPGDASTRRGVPVAEESFTVTNASTYASDDGSGTYLRTGNLVIMTSGPKKGTRYSVRNEGFLRHLGEDGKPDGMRCIRLGSAVRN